MVDEQSDAAIEAIDPHVSRRRPFAKNGLALPSEQTVKYCFGCFPDHVRLFIHSNPDTLIVS